MNVQKAHQVSSGPNRVGGGPLEFQQQHVVIPHPTRASEHGFDRRVNRLDDAEADGMVAVGGDALDMTEKEVAQALHLRKALPSQRANPAEQKVEHPGPRLVGPEPIELLAQDFASHLRQDQALSAATIAYYVPFARQLLTERFGRRDVDLGDLCAADVLGFVQRHARALPSRAKMMTTALRSFLRYARYRGDINIDLAAAVPAVANWAMTSIPRAIAPDHVRRVLAHCNRHTSVGRRDFAILMLLARLGLRSGEVVALTLEDIDWEVGHLRVCGKGRRECLVPLPADVGEAIAAYLQQGRPPSATRRLFLRTHAPFRGLGRSNPLGPIVKRAFARAGIDSPRNGAHQFRHGLATQMLKRGASLLEIGEVLRHRSPEITAIYTKVDLISLRELALPWPGGVQ